MDEDTRLRLLTLALAQRGLSIGYAALLVAFVVGSAVFAIGGRDLWFVVQLAFGIVTLYVAAVTFEMSRAMQDARGLRLTLVCVVIFIPFTAFIVPPMMLWRARTRLRTAGVEAGFLTVGREQMERLRREPGMAPVCVKCGYDLTGLAAGAVCPECGAAEQP